MLGNALFTTLIQLAFIGIPSVMFGAAIGWRAAEVESLLIRWIAYFTVNILFWLSSLIGFDILINADSFSLKALKMAPILPECF